MVCWSTGAKYGEDVEAALMSDWTSEVKTKPITKITNQNYRKPNFPNPGSMSSLFQLSSVALYDYTILTLTTIHSINLQFVGRF